MTDSDFAVLSGFGVAELRPGRDVHVFEIRGIDESELKLVAAVLAAWRLAYPSHPVWWDRVRTSGGSGVLDRILLEHGTPEVLLSGLHHVLTDSLLHKDVLLWSDVAGQAAPILHWSALGKPRGVTGN